MDLFTFVSSLLAYIIAVLGAESWSTYPTQPSVNVSDIKFLFYNDKGNVSYTSNSPYDDLTKTCRNGDDVTIIVHGWLESCSQLWIQNLVKNFNNRSIVSQDGCVVCMDYSKYAANSNFTILYGYFDSIAGVLTTKLQQFQFEGFSLEHLRLIGFSFGSVLAIKSGEKLWPFQVGSIDVMDPVNPAVDTEGKFSTDPKRAAQHVQCVHCSTNFGTPVHDSCHEDWVMGECGISQAAASVFPFGSHGLCPYFYVYGMQGNAFISVPKPAQCTADNSTLVNSDYYGVQEMGYKRRCKSPRGIFFAETFKCPPYDKDIGTCNSTVPTFPA